MSEQQRDICNRLGSAYEPPSPDTKVGIAIDTLGTPPLNALRHAPKDGTCGWYIWGGEVLSQAPEFFAPLHVAHILDYCPMIIPYLALAPGWRVLLAPGHEDAWFDEALLASHAGA